jgi:hypothetical protein
MKYKLVLWSFAVLITVIVVMDRIVHKIKSWVRYVKKTSKPLEN